MNQFINDRPSPFDVFLVPEALAINEARLGHLATLGLPLRNKTVLEVGGGIGLHTCFFESLGCDVLFTDARPDNLQEARRRYPHRRTTQLDLDHEGDLSRLGRFDIIYCYGTLYHLRNPSGALEALAAICDGAILLETCVTPGDECLLHPEPEPASVGNQAFSGVGCRPTRAWVMRELRSHMGFAYQTTTQPEHHDFEPNWLKPTPRKLYRAVFVGSKTPLDSSRLSDTPCLIQPSSANVTNAIWLDVGAHQGETSFRPAQANPTLQVYAFEPNVSLAAHLFNRLPNFHVLSLAIGEREGLVTFMLNACTAASSTLPMNETMRHAWLGGEELALDTCVMVPSMRLDHVMEALGIARVDFLKIDTQGGDFGVIKSGGERLADVRKVKLEVTITSEQLYVGAGTKDEIVAYMSDRGFALVAEHPQTHGQEENLVFWNTATWEPTELPEVALESFADDDDMRRALARLDDVQLVQVAREAAPVVSLQRVPGWCFDRCLHDSTLAARFRRMLWEVCRERRLVTPLVFHWYFPLKLHLHLGNDISLPTFVTGAIDPNEFSFLADFLKEGMTFLDVGANEGFYSVFAAHRVGSRGRVIAFEPSERELRRLTANVELNQLRTVTIEPVGLFDRDCRKTLRICEYGHEGQNTIGGFAYDVTELESQAVVLRSLDGYVREHQLDRVDFIKIDVEGAEERVLRGAGESLARFRPVLMLEMNERSLQFQGSCCHAIAEFLEAAGYRLYSFASATGMLTPCSTGYSDNIVAIPDERKASVPSEEPRSPYVRLG